MANAIRFSDEIEPLVHFVEETPGEWVVEETVTRLTEGTSPDRTGIRCRPTSNQISYQLTLHNDDTTH